MEKELTQKHKDILKVLATTGATNQELADEFDLSVKTIEAHLKEINRRIGRFHYLSRGKLIVWWWKNNHYKCEHDKLK